MTITAEELRKLYDAGSTGCPIADRSAMHDAALLAVARYVAEKQRAVEPTREMLFAGIKEMGLESAYRAMQSVAPLVVLE